MNRRRFIAGALFAGMACSTSELCAALPDLIPNRYLLERTVIVKKRSYPPEHCAQVEGCLRGAGTRKLLLFDTGIANVGKRYDQKLWMAGR